MSNRLFSRIMLLLIIIVVSANIFTTQSTSIIETPENYMWITKNEIMSLPMSGTAWSKIRSVAYGSWGTANLRNQDNAHAVNTLAGAFVYLRTEDVTLRRKVKNAILAAKRSFDQSSEWQTSNGVLSSSRQIGAYVIAADLINLKEYDRPVDREFRNWLYYIRTKNVGTHGRWKNISSTCENSAGNWNAFACATRIASSIYLNDKDDVDRSALIIRAFLGDRSSYPSDALGKDGYFQHTAGYKSSWSCNDSVWLAINEPCIKSEIDISGVIVEDASRGGECCIIQGDGNMYSWETLQGLFFSAELLYRTGNYNPYEWSGYALKRSLDFMERSGWNITSPSRYVAWLANFRYVENYPTYNVVTGRLMSWGDWLYNR